MKKIYKRVLEITGTQVIFLPRKSQILTCQIQRDKLCVWYLFDEEEKEVGHQFRIIGTGHPIEEKCLGSYIGTVQECDGQLVWHVFHREL